MITATILADAPSPNGVRLAPREREALLWAMRGCSIEETARHMYVAPSTVKHYRSRLCFYFDAPNMTVVAALAVRDGYLSQRELDMINENATEIPKR